MDEIGIAIGCHIRILIYLKLDGMCMGVYGIIIYSLELFYNPSLYLVNKNN